MVKSILKSKTIWVNLMTIVAGVLVYTQDHNLFVENPDTVAALAAVLGLVNVGLRFLTKTEVTLTGK